MTKKWVYRFDEVSTPDKMLLGGKGANLADMTKHGLPVPPGFTITTEACHAYVAAGNTLTAEMEREIDEAISALEARSGKRLGDATDPLLVSVRSGAPISMPGMMDTVLNLGLNHESVKGLARTTDNPRFAYDSFRRFIQMFSNVVLNIPIHYFERILDDAKNKHQFSGDQAVTAEVWMDVIQSYLDVVRHQTGRPFPMEPRDQLEMAIGAVFSSWNNPRAAVYRKVHQISESLGTAVNVQTMVFGNMGNDSGTGVAFTRNPSTGESELFGEYLINAQGEDVVAGIRTPSAIATLQTEMPAIYDQFVSLCRQLELHYRDVQDIEFTIERGRLYLLQTRNAKRSAQAAVKIAVDLAREGVIDKETALSRLKPEELDQLLHPSIDERVELEVIATGLPASPGAAMGQLVFDADRAEELAHSGTRVLLVRSETTPEDIHGIVAAEGVLTSRGGMTSHAAVVARGMGKPCVCGCDELRIDEEKGLCTVGDTVLREGDMVSIDGGTGRVMLGEIHLVPPTMSDAFETLMIWADEVRSLGVRANADTPEDAEKARSFGAEGIGLCRTEHMFMASDRLPVVQEMILASTHEERRDALERLLPMQRDDFYGILQAMDGCPVTIRLLDPPLHEFLPNLEELVAKQAALRTELSLRETEEVRDALRETSGLLSKVRALHEMNPMLGHRGCRLGLTMPEVYEMQARAVFEATAQLIEEGYQPKPEVMIPLVGHVEELRRMRELVERVCKEVQAVRTLTFQVPIGTMIEVPRAALTADEIAHSADFFSFGTNDLTQTTFGYSRDDAEGKFLHTYVESKVLQANPFATIDVDGVGQLVRIASARGRAEKPKLKLGVCGEHGGDKASISFFHQSGLDYVSCSPYRVPLARLSAAQAAIEDETDEKGGKGAAAQVS
ncbi:pyruvate, phosphate dikinase [Alicyclobacillus dauci]|uniref:Pyruvate, phosphate dikinase n=1 Tax=Alicyclobacillus dauci TaxID=1475485 RepID=A0ABY6Z5X1_9BACL|nr:pyruvate, phosphate dikinase [Alicyclobacillus dauci]WAH38222.1 pyruvate, phosphate dikinase [Alicyclobacillus dauci]